MKVSEVPTYLRCRSRWDLMSSLREGSKGAIVNGSFLPLTLNFSPHCCAEALLSDEQSCAVYER